MAYTLNVFTGKLDFYKYPSGSDPFPQYALADKTRPTPWVSAADLSVRSLADLGTRAHSDLTGIGTDDHHARDHELASTSGLGTTHTVAGLTAGQVLRASGATTAAFAQLSFADLGGSLSHSSLTDLTTPDDHTQYVKGAGRSGGQTWIGGTGTGENATIRSNASQDGVIRLGDDTTADEYVVVHGTDAGFDIDTVAFLSHLSVHEEGTAGHAVFAGHKHSNTAALAATAVFGRSGGTEASESAVADDYALMRLLGLGHNGTDYSRAVEILAEVDDPTPSTSSMGGALVFSTTAAGATSLTERLRIAQDGRLTVAGSGLGINGLPYVWPGSQAANRVLKTDGSSNLSWGQVAFSELTGSLAHTSLTGLTTTDAGHTQFLLLAGRSGGQAAFGGTSSSDHLDFSSNTASFAIGNTGRIRLLTRVTTPTSFTIPSGTATGAFMHVPSSAVYTISGSGATQWPWFRFDAVISLASNPTLSTMPAFWANQTIRPTAGIFDALSVWAGFLATPSWTPTASGATGAILTGVGSSPTSTPSVSTTIGTVSAFSTYASVFAAQFNGNVTITKWAHLDIGGPSAGGASITTEVGVDIAALNQGTTNLSLRSAGSGAQMRHAGAAVFGANAAVTNASVGLEVQSASKALLVSRVNGTGSIATPADGMIVYDTSANAFKFRENGAWVTGSGLT